MPSFEQLLIDKNKRLEAIPLTLQTTIEKQQKKVLSNILSKLNDLSVKNGSYEITKENLKVITQISDELKSVLLTDDYLKAVKIFSGEFTKQSVLNSQLIKSGYGSFESPIAAKAYTDLAKRSAIDALVGSPIDKEFIKPIQGLLESAVVNGSTSNELIENITAYVEGGNGGEGKLIKYVKQISNDSFAIADRSFTSIVSDALDNEWFYYAGSEVENTRCFCAERVGNYYHYKEIEAWGNGDNLGTCNIGGGKWAGQIDGTNSSTIYSYLGGYNCMHSLMPVSEFVVPESDMERAKEKGYIE